MATTIEQWNDYAQEAQDNLERVRGEVREKINDPNTSTADRDKAIIDLETQEHYVNWVQTQNDQIQQTGVIPSTMSIDSWSAGSGIWQDGQGKYRPARFINEPVAGNQKQIGTTYTQNVADLDGNVISFRAQVINTPSSSAVNFFRIKKVEYNSQNGYLSQFSMIAWDNEWYNQWKWQFGTSDSYKEQTVPQSWSSFSKYACISGCLTNEGTTPPIHTAFNDLCGVGDWDLVNLPSFNNLFKIVGESEITGGDVDPDAPWDFFNDNINPDIDPDNSIFPNGYEPESSGPETDPDDGPEEEDAPDKQDWGDPMQPNNGFQIPYAFSNYAAFNSDGIANFATRLWDAPDSFWEALTILNKNNANWLDYFINVRAYPYWINSTGIQANIYVGAGGQFYLGDEGEDLYASSPQHITYFLLHFNIEKYYNNFLDFAPYTKAQIYLPFSGTWEVNPKYLYHTNLIISLKLDITDGSGVWQVYRSGAESAGSDYIILQKQCKIGVDLPLSGLNSTTMSSNIVNATLGNFQRTGTGMVKMAENAASGALTAGLPGATAGVAIGAANMVMTDLENSVDMANANREQISVSGGMTGLAAANCNVIPSITLIRPVVQNPESFPHTVGYLVNQAHKLEDLTGYTTCRNVDVSNVGQATDKEKAQLKKILENGFFA